MLETGQTQVACPKCGHFNVSGATRCVRCETPTVIDSTTTVDSTTVDGISPGRNPFASEESVLSTGAVLAERYEIIKTLGAGGMGSVYQAFDWRLTRVVALKTIHPHPQVPFHLDGCAGLF